MSTSDWILIALEGLVVIGFIALGVRSGGIGLGLWGGVGTLVLVFGFGLDPGEPPISAMLIIVAVIAAAAAMEAAGGIDYMVLIASKALRARPKALNFVAPYISYVLTILTGTGNTFFSVIPVINELAYANKIRPERALAGSTVASTFGITSSPVAAAMATMLPLVEIYDYDIVDVMLITVPASIIGIFAMALFMNSHGKDLADDVEYQRRLAAGEIEPPAPAGEIVLKPYAKRSVLIFLVGVAAICVFGVFEGLRPTVAAEGGGVEPISVTVLIQMFMLTAAALILVLAHVQASDIASMPIFKSGMVAMIALFGIAWMADTFIANNEDAIVSALGSLAENWPITIALAIFLVAALTTSQSAATRTMIPLGLALGIGAGYMIAMWTAVAGVIFLPANGTQIAAAEADKTGTTTLGKRVIDHSFQLPLQICWIVTLLAGCAIVYLFFGDHTPAPPVPTTTSVRSLSVRGAAFLGIGAMVGAGIFALLGEAGSVAGSAVWLSFLLAGVVSALLGYTVVKMGVRFPSSGGLIAYLIEGFGNGRLVGIASWLGYFAAIVIVCSMVAVSFGSYATSLFIGNDAAAGWDNLFTTLVVVAMAGINIVGSKIVDQAQSLIVILLLAVFAVFIAVTLVDIDWDLLAFSGYPSFDDIIASVALTFFAYLGFSVITFTVGELRDPTRELPKAMYLALSVTTVLYVLIALGVFGTLTVAGGDRLRRDGDRRGRAADARGRRVHDDGGRRPARDVVVRERDALCLGRLDLDARGRRPVSAVFRTRLASRRARGHADHGRDRARGQQPRRPLRDRVGGERVLARDLPPRRCRRLPAARGHGRERRDRARRDRGDGCGPGLLRRRHVPQCAGDVHRDRGDHPARGGPRLRVEAHAARATADSGVAVGVAGPALDAALVPPGHPCRCAVCDGARLERDERLDLADRGRPRYDGDGRTGRDHRVHVGDGGVHARGGEAGRHLGA